MPRSFRFLFVLTALGALALAGGPARGEDYVVQVGSFATSEAAASESSRLLGLGVPSFQRTEEVAGVGLARRVYVGPFSTRAEANAAASALKSGGTIQDFLIRAETDSAPVAAPGVSAPVAPAAPAAADPGLQSAPVLVLPPSAGPATPPAETLGGAYGPAPMTGPGGESVGASPPPPPSVGQAAPDGSWPAAPESAPPRAVAPGETVYWGPEGGGAAPVNPADADWPAPTQAQLEALGAAPAAPPALPPAAPLVVGPPIPENTPTLAPAAPLAVGPPIPETTPTLSPAAPAAPPATDWGASPAFGGPAPSAATPPSAPAPGKPYQKINGFAALVDLSSSELWLSPCQGGLVKAEAETILLRKMSHRIPNLPYVAALRVFGYKQAWREIDYTALYYGPTAFARDDFEAAVGRLAPANAISPFSVGIRALNQELAAMSSPRAILMFSDFEVTSSNPGDPPGEARKLRDLYGAETRFYSFYSTKDKKARTLANNIAAAGGGIAYDMCAMLEDEAAFEAMMMEIFGPKEEPPCADADGDGVCDDKDVCPSTPPGAPVDARGCWIAAYSQFFDFDKSEVKSQFYPRLESAAQIIKDNPQIARVTIAGHADAKGSDAYNLELGRKRAEAVKALLVKYGAQPERLVVESFGKSAPIADNSTEEGRAQNRRVEFHVGDVPPEAR